MNPTANDPESKRDDEELSSLLDELIAHPKTRPIDKLCTCGQCRSPEPYIHPATTDAEYDRLKDSLDPLAVRRGREWNASDDRRYYNAHGWGWR